MNTSNKNHKHKNTSKIAVSKTIKILMLCAMTTFGYAQKKANKTSQSIKVSKDVVVDLNTSYVEIEVDTWNKDVVGIEAYIEGEKLTEIELKDALKSWNLKVDATSDRVTISSEGGSALGNFPSSSYDGLLKSLEFDLADLPDLPEIGNLPIIPSLKNFPALPKMPEFPALPELPDGVNTIQFDYDKYQKEGEKYLTSWSKQYEKQGGKELQKRMEDWAKKFVESDYEKKMTKWGEEFGEKFGNEWAEKMEAWGERLGKKTDKTAEMIEKRTVLLEKRAEQINKNSDKIQHEAELNKRIAERNELINQRKNERQDALNKRLKEREALINNRKSEYHLRKETLEEQRINSYLNNSEYENNSKVRKVIKIKIPKNAKLKLNVRHGELKVASLVQNIQGDVSHTFLVAEHIGGKDTSINVSYSPVVINTWDLGTLNLNFVDKAQIKNAQNLVLNSKSSNMSIGSLTDTGIIDGSFGDLTISNLTETFRTLNLVLENSDALINLPSALDYNFYFNGNRSKYNNKPTTQKTIRKDDNGQNANRNIMVNAKFSNVIIN